MIFDFHNNNLILNRLLIAKKFDFEHDIFTFFHFHFHTNSFLKKYEKVALT